MALHSRRRGGVFMLTLFYVDSISSSFDLCFLFISTLILDAPSHDSIQNWQCMLTLKTHDTRDRGGIAKFFLLKQGRHALPYLPATLSHHTKIYVWCFSNIITINFILTDDRPEYASTKAFLYGHYLLAGLSCGAWDLKNGSASSHSDWILPVPAAYNSQLISLTQESANKTLFLSNLNVSREDQERTVTMEESPKLGTNAAAQATFRLVYNNTRKSQFPAPKDLVGESIMLEPFDLPGRLVKHRGPNKSLVVTVISEMVSNRTDTSKFRVAAGLDGDSSTISLESESTPGCFVYHKIDDSASKDIQLLCQGDKRNDTAFHEK